MQTIECDILLIEDSDSDAFLIRKSINRFDPQLTVHCIKRGEEALAYLRSSPAQPRLIFLDINLEGGMDGITVLADIRRKLKLHQIPVLMLTGAGSPARMSLALELGAQDFIIKPSTLDGLFARINRALNEWLSLVLSRV